MAGWLASDVLGQREKLKKTKFRPRVPNFADIPLFRDAINQ